MRNTKMDMEQQMEIMEKYMARVNKLVVGRSTTDKFFGKAELVKAAKPTKKIPSGYGTRKFKVTDSKNIADGTYTLGKLRAALAEAIQG